MTNQKYYVSATDKFMSNWGMSKGKTNKIVFQCDNYEEVKTVKNNLNDRTEMIRISVSYSKPKYNEKKYQVSYKTKRDTPNFYKADYFKNQL